MRETGQQYYDRGIREDRAARSDERFWQHAPLEGMARCERCGEMDYTTRYFGADFCDDCINNDMEAV